MNGGADEKKRSAFQRADRITAVLVTVIGSALLLHWTLKWLSGQPDEYPHQTGGGLLVSVALTLGGLMQLVASASLRRTLLAMFVASALLSSVVIFGDLHLTPTIIFGIVIVIGGIVTMVHALWPERGMSLGEWKVRPVTIEQRREVCTGFAVMNVGFAVFVTSIIGFARGAWPMNLVSIIPTLMFLGTAAGFIWARGRISTPAMK